MNPHLFDLLQQRWERRWRDHNKITQAESFEFDHDHYQHQLDVYLVFNECNEGDPGAIEGDKIGIGCPICGAVIRAKQGTFVNQIRVVIAPMDEPDDEDEDPQELARRARILELAECKKRYPHIVRWLHAGNEPTEIEDAYGLEECVGYDPAYTARPGDPMEPTPDTGIYSTCWAGNTQIIWQDSIYIKNQAERELRLTNDDERRALIALTDLYKQEPDWDRSTQEAFDHAMSKDD